MCFSAQSRDEACSRRRAPSSSTKSTRLAGNKRGSHLALSIERLAALDEAAADAHRPVGDAEADRGDRAVSGRDVGIAQASRLRGRRHGPCPPPRSRHRGAVLAAAGGDVERGVAGGLHAAGATRAEHRTTLIFVNTRRMAERAARHLSELIGPSQVMSHHGSMSKERRLDAEQRLKYGTLKVLVATASLELGIDIGDVDSSVNWDRLDRLRRSCNGPGAQATRSAASPRRACSRSRATNSWNAHRCSTPSGARNSTGSRSRARRSTCWRSRSSPKSRRTEWPEDALFELVRRAYPYRDLERERLSRSRTHRVRRLQHAARSPARRMSIATRSTACCAGGAARGSPR